MRFLISENRKTEIIKYFVETKNKDYEKDV